MTKQNRRPKETHGAAISPPNRQHTVFGNVLLALGATVFPTVCTLSLAFDHVHLAIWSGVTVLIALTGWIALSALQLADTRVNRAFARKIFAIGLSVAIIMGVVIELIAFRNRNRISVSIGFFLYGDDRDTSGALWLARRDYVAPVNAAVLVRITNLTGSPVAIDKFECLLNDVDGKWSELLFMHAAGQLYCCAPDKTKIDAMHRVEFDGGGLFRVLENAPVPPHGQVTNWLTFEYPPGFRPNREGLRLRLSFWDYTGQVYTGARPVTNENDSAPSERKPRFNPVVQEELDRLILKTIASPPVNLANFRLGHVYDELPTIPAR